MIRFIQRHIAFFGPLVLIGSVMNLISQHAVWSDRLFFFLVAAFPATLIALGWSSKRDGDAALLLARRRQSLAAKAHALVWEQSLNHPDLQRSEDPRGDWMRLLMAPSGSAIKMMSERPLDGRVLREISAHVACHGETLIRLYNLSLVPNEDPTWMRINALATALSERDFDAYNIVDLLKQVENALSDAIPAPANLQQETA